MPYYHLPNLDDTQQYLIGLSQRGARKNMNEQTMKDVDRAFKALEALESTKLRCIYCKHCAAIYKNSRNEAIKVQCGLYSSPMREFECFEKDPLINIEQ